VENGKNFHPAPLPVASASFLFCPQFLLTVWSKPTSAYHFCIWLLD